MSCTLTFRLAYLTPHFTYHTRIVSVIGESEEQCDQMMADKLNANLPFGCIHATIMNRFLAMTDEDLAKLRQVFENIPAVRQGQPITVDRVYNWLCMHGGDTTAHLLSEYREAHIKIELECLICNMPLAL